MNEVPPEHSIAGAFREDNLDCRWVDSGPVGRADRKRKSYGWIGGIIVGVIGGLLDGWIASYFFHNGRPAVWHQPAIHPGCVRRSVNAKPSVPYGAL